MWSSSIERSSLLVFSRKGDQRCQRLKTADVFEQSRIKSLKQQLGNAPAKSVQWSKIFLDLAIQNHDYAGNFGGSA
jgi:hypothetical protein